MNFTWKCNLEWALLRTSGYNSSFSELISPPLIHSIICEMAYVMLICLKISLLSFKNVLFSKQHSQFQNNEIVNLTSQYCNRTQAWRNQNLWENYFGRKYFRPLHIYLKKSLENQIIKTLLKTERFARNGMIFWKTTNCITGESSNIIQTVLMNWWKIWQKIWKMPKK